MIYGLCGLAGFLLAVFLYNVDDIKRKRKRKKIAKRYERLRRGIPKRVVFLNDLDDLFDYRNYPILINGEVYSIDMFQYWHCNDECKTLLDINNKQVGYIRNRIDMYGYKNKREYIYSLCLSKSYSSHGKRINVSAVVEVY